MSHCCALIYIFTIPSGVLHVCQLYIFGTADKRQLRTSTALHFREQCVIFTDIYIYTQSQYIQSVHPAAVAQKIQKYLLPNHQTTDQLLFSILNSFSTQILSLVQHKETTTCILYYIPVLQNDKNKRVDKYLHEAIHFTFSTTLIRMF